MWIMRRYPYLICLIYMTPLLLLSFGEGFCCHLFGKQTECGEVTVQYINVIPNLLLSNQGSCHRLA